MSKPSGVKVPAVTDNDVILANFPSYDAAAMHRDDRARYWGRACAVRDGGRRWQSKGGRWLTVMLG